MNYQEILNKGIRILKASNIKSSSLDCELILSKVLNKKREEILINLKNEVNKKQVIIIFRIILIQKLDGYLHIHNNSSI